MNNFKSGEYLIRGEYHKNLSKDWAYYPVYLSKENYLMEYFKQIENKNSMILDIGCGEGAFIDLLISLGFKNVQGVDENYASQFIKKGSVYSLPYQNNTCDIALFLDVIEHLNFDKQEIALKEIKRILKPDGALIITIPNLAHLYSRIRFLLKGKLSRTAACEKHPGDRPIKEYIELLEKRGFEIQKRHGFFPTIPFIYKYIQRNPSKSIWLYKIINYLFCFPNICFLNIMICKPLK